MNEGSALVPKPSSLQLFQGCSYLLVMVGAPVCTTDLNAVSQQAYASQIHGLLSKSWVPFGYRLYYGTL